MKESTPAQRSAIGAIVAKLGLDKEGKAELVSQYSNGRTNSSTGLSFEEAGQMLHDLTPGPSPRERGAQTPAGSQKAHGVRMRRQIIAIFHEMGAHLPGTAKIDMERVNAWCTNQGHDKKPLNDYTYEELPKLVGQAKKYLEWYLKKV